jgi:hypothetical protein
MAPQLNVTLHDTVFDPDGGPQARTEVRYRQDRSGTTLYKVWLYLQGRDLPYVQRVIYKLHPTFPNPERVVERSIRNPNCEIILWTWGLFEVTAIIEDKKGRLYELRHQLEYDRELTLGIRYVQDTDGSSGEAVAMK